MGRAIVLVIIPTILLGGCAGSRTTEVRATPMALSRQVVPVPGHPGVGPYSHAIRAGDFLFISGQPGLDPTTAALVGSTFESQARQALANLVHVLRAAGSGPENVVRTTVWLTDTAHFQMLNKLYAEVFVSDPPTRSTPTVQLPRGILISIDAIAIAPTRRERKR